MEPPFATRLRLNSKRREHLRKTTTLCSFSSASPCPSSRLKACPALRLPRCARQRTKDDVDDEDELQREEEEVEEWH
jgi:hypothetical protein